MAHHYIVNQPGVGYIVAQLETEDNWHTSNRYVANFADGTPFGIKESEE